MSPRADCGSRSTARSPSDTIPTGRPPSTTGSRRTAFSRISRTTSSTVSSGVRVVSSALYTSRTGVDAGSRPLATARTVMSRSVTMPATRSPSTTTTAPTSASAMMRAASTTGAPASTVLGSDVMTSRTLCAMAGSFRFHNPWCPLVDNRAVASAEMVSAVSGQGTLVGPQVGLRDDADQPVAFLDDQEPVELVLGQQLARRLLVLVGPDRHQVLGGDVAHRHRVRVTACGHHPGDDVPVGDHGDDPVAFHHGQRSLLLLDHPLGRIDHGRRRLDRHDAGGHALPDLWHAPRLPALGGSMIRRYPYCSGGNRSRHRQGERPSAEFGSQYEASHRPCLAIGTARQSLIPSSLQPWCWMRCCAPS